MFVKRSHFLSPNSSEAFNVTFKEIKQKVFFSENNSFIIITYFSSTLCVVTKNEITYLILLRNYQYNHSIPPETH